MKIKNMMGHLSIDELSARKLLKALRCDTHEQLEALWEGYADYLQPMYNRPLLFECVMAYANELIGGHGVDGIEDDNGDWLTYVNTGDTYSATLIHYAGRYKLSTWGDMVENNQQFQSE